MFREVLEAFLEKGMPELGIEKEESASQTSWKGHPRQKHGATRGSLRYMEHKSQREEETGLEGQITKGGHALLRRMAFI